ncbi:hypothetical protein Clacol_007267 [Clathrus columnatus]|uniref:Eukaryotic translation initiation factor 3 subunit L n=1 Tax=Clathrus columnatus TaxID=1419009 RepID=A0AAV5AJZ5_9AGAM|nr:hypothetical protein Clacol_007267 [Clathrus columnatus]
MSTRPQLWTTEAEIDEDLAEVDINVALGNYGQGQVAYDVVGIPPVLNNSTLLAMQQQIAQQAALSQIPEVVKRFIVHFHKAIVDQNITEITAAYESGWNKLTEKFYSKQEWPEAEIIAPLIGDVRVSLLPVDILGFMGNSDSESPPPLSLPDQWLWDIIDEFIYQFQSFSVWRSRVRQKSEEEIQLLATEGGQVWSCYSVLNVLYSFIQKSKINEHVAALQRGASPEEIADIVGEYGSKPLYQMLGYFSIIGLLRVHTLLGDFTLALKVMDNIELSQKAFFTRVTACHVAAYYYVGFCYMALRRYPDAARTFVSILNFILRMRSYHTRSYQYDQINKTADRMYALFAICNALSPSRLDDNILNIVKERYGEQVTKMAQGEEGLAAFEELFLYACPKFISANPPPYHDASLLGPYLETPSPIMEPAQHHLGLFMNDVKNLLAVPTLRSFLRLYTSLDTAKLASFLDKEEEDVVREMMVMKQASRSVSRATVSSSQEKERIDVRARPNGSLLDGETISTSDLDFVINQNMIHVAETTVGRRYAGWFIRNTEHAQRVLDTLRATPLPVVSPTPLPGHVQGPVNDAKPTAAAARPNNAWGATKKVEIAA